MSILFSPYTLRSITLRNRVAIPPMSLYMARDGLAQDFHFTHYASLAKGGAGLIIVEATAVSPEGRVTPDCLGIWNDKQACCLARIATSIKSAGSVPGIQISHAGRKGNSHAPWKGFSQLDIDDPDYWEIESPSAIPFGRSIDKHFGQALERTPRAMTRADIIRVQSDFAAAARRARDAGFEWLELHFAHGFLGQSFFSIHANQRDDEYGGNEIGRNRFLLETLIAVRREWPSNFPLTVRFGVIEYDGKDEETLQSAIRLTQAMAKEGLDLLNVSIGFSIPDASVPWREAFLVPIAGRIRRETGVPVATAWIGNHYDAESALQNRQIDIAMIGRAHLANPHWTYHAAKSLGVKSPTSLLPISYGYWLEKYQNE